MNQLTPQEPITAASGPESTLWRWLTDPQPRRWLLPITGLWILGLDWLLFTQNTVVLGLATPLLVVIGFLGGAAGAYFFQRRFAKNRGPSAWLKSLFAGIVVGIPLPLAGTVVGGWILLASGLGSIKDRLPRK
jgi:hypothetical protein